MLAKIFILFAVSLISVHSFSSSATRRRNSRSELNAFFFPKPNSKSPTLSIENEKKSKFANPFAKKSAGQEEAVVKAATKKSSLLSSFNAKKTPVEKPLSIVKKASAKSSTVSSKPKKTSSAGKVSKVFTGVTGKSFAAKSSSKKNVSFRPSKKTASMANGSKEKKLVIYERVCHIN